MRFPDPRPFRISLATLLSAALLAGCSSGDSTPEESAGTVPASEQAQQDLKDIGEYTLTMDKIDKYFAASIAMAKATKNTPVEEDADEVDDDLTGADEGEDTVDGMADQIERIPEARKAVIAAGLTPREYALISYAYIQAGMGAAIAQMRPNDNVDSLAREMKANPKNVRFMLENADALQAKAKQVEAQVQAMEDRTGDEE